MSRGNCHSSWHCDANFSQVPTRWSYRADRHKWSYKPYKNGLIYWVSLKLFHPEINGVIKGTYLWLVGEGAHLVHPIPSRLKSITQPGLHSALGWGQFPKWYPLIFGGNHTSISWKVSMNTLSFYVYFFGIGGFHRAPLFIKSANQRSPKCNVFSLLMTIT